MFSRKLGSMGVGRWLGASRWLAVGLPLACAVFVSCGGDDLSCGTGTTQSGSQCVPALSDMGGAGGDSSQAEVDFDGVTGVAPVSETVLLVTWGRAVPADATFNVYLSKKKDGFNFSSPQATAPAGSRAIEVAALDEDTEYFVTVRASVGGDEDGNTVVKSATTQKDTKAPKFAGATKAEPASAAAVKIGWKAATDDLTPAESLQYVVYYGALSTEINFDTPIAVSAPGVTNIVVSDLPIPDTEYFFVVRARDAAGNMDTNPIAVSAKSGPDTNPPVFAGCASATPQSAAEIAVSWQPASDDTAKTSDLVYEVFASKTPDGHNFSEPSFVSTPGATSGIVPDLDRDTTYYLVCRAKDTAGNSDENEVFRSAKTKSDGEPPEFTGVPVAQDVGPNSFKITWSAATDKQTSSDKIVYDVYLKQTPGEDFDPKTPWVTSGAGDTEVLVEGLTTNTTYYVTVLARDLAGNRSTNDDEITVITNLSFAKDVQPIFNGNCLGCHGDVPSPGAGMRLDKLGGSYGNLVNVLSTSWDSSKMRVNPFDPDNSVLWIRVHIPYDGDPNNDGARMPGEPSLPLTEEQVATIYAWIEQGALNN